MDQETTSYLQHPLCTTRKWIPGWIKKYHDLCNSLSIVTKRIAPQHSFLLHFLNAWTDKDPFYCELIELVVSRNLKPKDIICSRTWAWWKHYFRWRHWTWFKMEWVEYMFIICHQTLSIRASGIVKKKRISGIDRYRRINLRKKHQFLLPPHIIKIDLHILLLLFE